MSTATFASSLMNNSEQSSSFTNSLKDQENVYSLSRPNTFDGTICADLAIANTLTINVIDAMVSSVKEEISQFLERYIEYNNIETGFESFAPSSIKPKSVRNVRLHVKKAGRGKPTIAFHLDELAEEENILSSLEWD